MDPQSHQNNPAPASSTTASILEPAAVPFFSLAEGTLYSEPVSEDPRAEVRRRKSTKRKQTLLALLDELMAFKDEVEEEEQPTDGQARTIPHVMTERIRKHTVVVDAGLQKEGVKRFWDFHRRVRQVDETLQSFGNAVRPLGSCAGLISSAYFLRARLQQVLHLFRENASELFDEVKKEPIERMRPLSSRKRSKNRANAPNLNFRAGLEPTKAFRVGPPLTSDLEDFPQQFKELAKDLLSFLHFLHDIPEFTDDALNASVLSFEADLKYWASCIEEYKTQFKFPAIRRYMNDLTREMDEHLDNIQSALRIFKTDGVSTIRTAQNHTQTGLQNLSTVATFFSGVTASTLQYTFDRTDSTLDHIVNALWISSLVFSIASSINSQLAYHWRAAMYRSPRSAVPWWVSIWLTRTPLIFLVVSVMAFSAGLVCFTYASGQKRLVTSCATIFTSFTSSALLAVAIWFALERFVFARTKGSRWLADYWKDARSSFMKKTGLNWFTTVPPQRIKAVGGKLSRAGTSLYRASSNVFPPRPRALSECSSGYGESEDYMSAGAPGSNGNVGGSLPMYEPSGKPTGHARRFSESTLRSIPSRKNTASPGVPQTILEGVELRGSPVQERNLPLSQLAILESPMTIDFDTPTSPAPPTPKARFQAAARQIGRSQMMGNLFKIGNSHTRQQTVITVPGGRQETLPPSRSRSYADGTAYPARPPRVAVVMPALKKMAPTQILTEHHGLVRHLQFSPDGKWLATGSWDRRAIIWKVDHQQLSLHKVLAHPGQGFIGQVAWSPDGCFLLTKMHKTIKVWTARAGVCIKTVNRTHHIEAVTWLPDSKAFACVEHDRVHIMDLQAIVQHTHDFPRMEIHDVAFTPDAKRMMLVGTLEMSKDKLKPSKSRAEKRIVVYDLDDDSIENQVPLLRDVRDITVSSDGTHALVSYEDKAPPELWRIDLVKDEGRLALSRTFIPENEVEWAGPSYFGGLKDLFVICAGKKGDIHIWDRETGLLLHTLQGANVIEGIDEDVTSIAWNRDTPGHYMFASATHDGAVKIWTASAPPETQPPSRVGSPAPSERRIRLPGDLNATITKT